MTHATAQKLNTLGRLAELTDLQAAEYMPGRDLTRSALADKCRREGHSARAITIAYVVGTAGLNPGEEFES